MSDHSVTATVPTTPAPAKPKRPYRKRYDKVRTAAPAPAPAPAPAAAASDDEFPGMTAQECSFECTEERCIITHINVCGHPAKGGLQAALQNDPERKRRYARARRYLARQKVELRE